MYEPNQIWFIRPGLYLRMADARPTLTWTERATRALVEIGLSGFRCWGYGRQQARL